MGDIRTSGAFRGFALGLQERLLQKLETLALVR
jgi:hypothetical protein